LYSFFWGFSPASEFYVPTFRNTLSVPSSNAVFYTTYEVGTDRVIRKFVT